MLTAILDLSLRPDDLEASLATLREILVDTRAFPGCAGVEVLVDTTDPTHVVVFERWDSDEADAAYRAWRAGEGASGLGDLLAAPPTLTRFHTVD
ncbi:antibiotic biosynthesis monooxygenase family protein [Pseudonocardia sp. WMMC193]|uniref:putative quinol monooxygenase n=1 Tax=Pseudonocardia sp. WMMC193 TaxID=2911965 RepID=UPI001F3D33BE|nr:antibiotic biosynthesis monooxygenase family protein [Pseudonocardia sp. WMMC193]MCF7551035.1 antibiotic biosynthesis monooxygenase [Pseudonocardia sp. WMMC193]